MSEVPLQHPPLFQVPAVAFSFETCVSEGSALSHIMCLLVNFRKSTLPQDHQLTIYFD
jgi:hypothetical protein